MTEDRDAYLDRVLIGGREPVSITVVEYDQRWPQHFHKNAEQIRAVLGPRALKIEHVGSTSVPGLAAKPIIDILLTVDDINDEAAYVPALQSVGFVLRVREDDHRMLRTPARDVHLHVLEASHPEVTNMLVFRDWLRTSETDRQLYADIKKQLARQQWVDMNEYADAKADVVQQILARAKAWQAEDLHQ